VIAIKQKRGKGWPKILRHRTEGVFLEMVKKMGKELGIPENI